MLFSDPSPCEQLSSWPPLPPVVLTLNLQCATLLSTEHFTFTGKIISILCDVFSPLSSPRLKYLQNFPRSRVGEASCFFVKTNISTPLISSSTHFFFFSVVQCLPPVSNPFSIPLSTGPLHSVHTQYALPILGQCFRQKHYCVTQQPSRDSAKQALCSMPEGQRETEYTFHSQRAQIPG